MPTTTVRARNIQQANSKARKKVGKNNTVVNVALNKRVKPRRGQKQYSVVFRRSRKSGVPVRKPKKPRRR